ncbi:MAG: Rid family detoxifying hydrolase [Bacteroidales bacterium]
MKTAITSKHAPTPIGPYSQAILQNNTLYISGQLPYNVAEDFIINTDYSMATKQVMENIETILHEADMDFSDVCMCSIFLKDITKFEDVNAVYFNFVDTPFPARQVIEVSALPMNAIIEISVIAQK